MKKSLLPIKFFLFLTLFLLDVATRAQTSVEKSGDEWVLKVDGDPFYVKGVTFGYDRDTANYDRYFEELNFLGVNSIRTWGADENTPHLLDAADKYGIKVMLGIWMRHGRPGMEADDSFDYLKDTEGKEAMYRNALEVVRKYKDHPAILSWGVGNEVYLNMATDEEKRVYSQLLERICHDIKKADKNHPITSVEAWTFGVKWWSDYVPSIDIYGINTYGAGADFIPEEFAKQGVDKPYVITEFGVRGEWEIEEDKKGVKPEPSDAEKYETIVKGYKEWIKPKSACLGVYVFHYGNSKEFVGPWYLTHFHGMTRPQYWAIREAYTGKKPLNEVPVIESFDLPEGKVKSEAWVPVELGVSDKEEEKLAVEFYYNHRKGSRKRRDQIPSLSFRGSLSEGYEILVPQVHGGIKVYAAVRDEFNNVGLATTSLSVIDKEETKRKVLVPDVELPFFVYDDNDDLPYIPSAYMGDFENLKVDMANKEDVKSGETAVKITYEANDGWYGLGFVDPPDDWGDRMGGYDIRGAETFSFWAKANRGEVAAEVGFGMIKDDKPYPDSGIKRTPILLTGEWKKYTIETKDMDLSCIRSGFVIFSNARGRPHEIYFDRIVFE